MQAFFQGVERLQGQLRAVTRCVWGLTIGSDPPDPRVPLIRGLGFGWSLGKITPFLETDGLQILTEYVEVAYVPYGAETWFWDTLIRTFYTLWYWCYATICILFAQIFQAQ
jgi:hypothetical protein